MPRKEINILAVNPGTKYLGLAVFEGPDLVYWVIKAFKGKWSNKKKENITKSLLVFIHRYDISVLTLKNQNKAINSQNIDDLKNAIKALAKNEKIKLQYYSLSDIKQNFTVTSKVNKMDIAGIVANRYPFLNSYIQKERKNKHEYFIRMFEAIAAGIFAYNKLSR